MLQIIGSPAGHCGSFWCLLNLPYHLDTQEAFYTPTSVSCEQSNPWIFHYRNCIKCLLSSWTSISFFQFIKWWSMKMNHGIQAGWTHRIWSQNPGCINRKKPDNNICSHCNLPIYILKQKWLLSRPFATQFFRDTTGGTGGAMPDDLFSPLPICKFRVSTKVLVCLVKFEWLNYLIRALNY